MKIRFPIITVDEKEMWEREEAELQASLNNDSLESLGLSSSNEPAVPFTHERDRVVSFTLDLANVHIFYQTYVHFNDKEMDGVRVRLHDGYWPPVFAVPYALFEQLYKAFHRGELFCIEDEIVIGWEEALEYSKKQ